ncbi:MAG: hypothetical protein V1754_06945 [Pseudomonadota bacterium]
MAWVVSNLFVRCSDQRTVVEELRGLLRQTDHQTAAQGILEAPPPIVVTPAVENWTCIVGTSSWFDNIQWVANHFSKTCNDLSISCELVGCAYCLRYAEYNSGRKNHLLLTPNESWASDSELKGSMPMYEDVEQIAYNSLQKIGISPVLITLGTSPFGHSAKLNVSLGKAMHLLPQGKEIKTTEFELNATNYESEDAPVLPREFSEEPCLMLLDSRYVEGKPNRKKMERLLQLEEKWVERAQRACPDRKVTATVTYHAGRYQPELDTLLSNNNKYVLKSEREPTVPWWQFWHRFGLRKKGPNVYL